MYSISIAVHRLVLIVNSWDVFGGTGEGRKASPVLLFCSGLVNPSLFVFVLFVFSLSWRS